MKLYIVFETTSSTYDHKNDKYLSVEAQFCGAFDNLDEAVQHCTTDYHWIGSGVHLNEAQPDESLPWPEYYDKNGEPIDKDQNPLMT